MSTSARAHFAVLGAYRRLVDAVARESRGAARVPAPAWAGADAIESISLALCATAPSSQAPTLTVALRDGVPGRCVPSSWQPWPGAPGVPVRVIRRGRARAQAAPGVQGQRSALRGTATAIVRDRASPDNNFVLTCGHVMAPDMSAQRDDIATIGGGRIGYLKEWQPAIGDAIHRTPVDGALLAVHLDDCLALRQETSFIPASVGGALSLDLPITVRRADDPLNAFLKIYWSGSVDLPDVTPGYPDYFLTDAIGYAAVDPTIPGDSGAAIWDRNDALLGMHIGSLPDATPGEANAVMTPIGQVLDWFNVQPYTRTDPATAPATSSGARVMTPQARAVSAASTQASDQVSTVAQTLWGEARGQGEAGMRGVASVIANRLRLKWRGATTPAAVCLSHRQFSCWNDDDPNRLGIEKVKSNPDAQYMIAQTIAGEVVAGSLVDTTYGATHYVASTLRQRPSWLQGKSPCVVIGDHEFYNNIS